MTVPVIKELLNEYPDLQITFVSRPLHAALFKDIERLHFYPINTDDYKGVFGIQKMAKEISKAVDFDAVADLHNVLRTKLLRVFLATKSNPVAVIGKGRTAKSKLTAKNKKEFKPLKLTVQRYADVFNDIGLPFDLINELEQNIQPLNDRLLIALGQKKSNWVGIAPFARHKGKRMPFSKAETVIESLSKLPNMKIMLFGGGKLESEKLQSIADDFRNVYNIAGKFKLADELDLMSHLDVMVSMDSANMHMASLMGVPVVSVWGATHTHAGFLGYGQTTTDSVQSDLGCRPCSVFGDKECWRGDYACLHQINEEEILIKVSNIITKEIDNVRTTITN